MKRKAIRIILLFSIVALAATVLSSCGLFGSGDKTDNKHENPVPEHEHIYAENWAYDMSNHWRRPICGCGEEAIKDKSAHDFGTTYDIVSGGHKYTCSVCGFIKTVGHRYGTDEKIEYGTYCTDGDLHIKTCDECGYVGNFKENVDIHEFAEWTTEGDKHVRLCNKCPYKDEHEIKTTQPVEILHQGCETEGELESRCLSCGMKITEKIPADGHSWIYTKNEDDLETHIKRCGNYCGAQNTERHSFGVWRTTGGTAHFRTCEDCGYTEYEFHSSVCSDCGGTKGNASSGLMFSEFLTEGTVVGYVVAGIGTFRGPDLVIPDVHNGLPVVAIADGAFSGCTYLVSVYVPDSVQKIGDGAFSGCSGIVDITVPFVGETAKEPTESDQKPFGFIFGTTYYEGSKAVNQFYSKEDGKSSSSSVFYLPAGLRCVTVNGGHILSGAFWNCSDIACFAFDNILSFHLENGYGQGFVYCNAVTEIKLGRNVTADFSRNNMIHSKLIKKITVAEGNPRYRAAENCLIDGETVVFGNAAGTLPDDETVTAIGKKAFYDCTKIVEITLPKSITFIDTEAFVNCSGLVSAEFLSDTELFIGEGAFKYCTQLQKVEINAAATVGNVAFDECGAITSVAFTKGATIGNRVFRNKPNLTEAVVCGGAGTLGEETFERCANLESVTIGEGITEMGNSCFAECVKLTSFVLPDSVERVGSDLFKGCVRLSSVKTGSGLKIVSFGMFDGCVQLASVELNDGLGVIGQKAFSGCKELITIVVPDSVYSIGNSAFSGCSKLTSMVLPFCGTSRYAGSGQERLFGAIFGQGSYDGGKYTQQYYGTGNYANTFCYIPQTLRSVTIKAGYLDHAFYNCTGLTEIVIEGVEKIFQGAFANCSGITEIVVPESVDNVSAGAFVNCTALKKVVWNCDTVYGEGRAVFENCYGVNELVVGGSVKSIQPYAFATLKGIKEMVLPDSVTDIGFGTFAGCTSLESIVLPFFGKSRNAAGGEALFGYIFGSNATYGGEETIRYDNKDKDNDRLFYIPESLVSVTVNGENLTRGAFYDCKNLVDVTLTGEITALPQDLFYGCRKLSGFSFPKDVAEIGVRAFFGCASLAAASLPEGTVTVGNEAFAGCESLEEISLPQGLSSLGDGAFSECARLTEISLPDSVVSIGNGAFFGCELLASVSLPTGIEEISDGLFENCFKLSSIVLYDGIESIGKESFKSCKALALTSLPTDLVSIGQGAFEGCTAMRTMTVPAKTAEIGSRAFFGCDKLGEITFAGEISEFPESMCEGCKELESIIASQAVDSIGKRAFAGCLGLTSFDIEVLSIGEECFAGSGLATVELRTDLVSLGQRAFADCENLVSVDYRAATLSYGSGDGAFIGCDHFTVLDIGEEVQDIPGDIFKGSEITELTIPSSVKTIGARAFYGCDRVHSLEVFDGEDNTLSVGNEAFFGMKEITSAVMPKRTVEIGKGAFGGMASLAEITLPFVGTRKYYYASVSSMFGVIFGDTEYEGGSSVLQINSETETATYCIPNLLTKVTVTGDSVVGGAFSGCENIEEIGVAGLIRLQDYVFYNCKNLNSLSVSEHVVQIGRYALSGCESLQTLPIGEDTDSIKEYAFYGCKSATGVVLPSGVTVIESHAFEGCVRIRSIDLSAVVEMGEYAFYGCEGLSSLNISSVTSQISEYAFAGCKNVTSVTIAPSGRSLNIGNYAFAGMYQAIFVSFPKDRTAALGQGVLSGWSSLGEISLPFTGRSLSETGVNGLFGYIFGVEEFAGGVAVEQVYSDNVNRRMTYYVPSALRTVNYSGQRVKKGAFSGLSMINTVSFSTAVDYIDARAFYECSALTGVVFSAPSDWEKSGSSAFYTSYTVTSADVGNSHIMAGYLTDTEPYYWRKKS